MNKRRDRTDDVSTKLSAVSDSSNSGDMRAHHEDAGGHHGGGVDQRADRRRAFHRIGQPDVQRELRALAHRTDEQADAGHRHQHPVRRPTSGKVILPSSRRLGEDFGVVQRAERRPHSRPMPRMKPKSPTRLTRKAFMLANTAVGFLKPEADEQVADQAHRFPAEEQLQEVVAHHQHQHAEGEQADVAEEALVAGVALPCSRWCRRAPSATRRSPRTIIMAVRPSTMKPTSITSLPSDHPFVDGGVEARARPATWLSTT